MSMPNEQERPLWPLQRKPFNQFNVRPGGNQAEVADDGTDQRGSLRRHRGAAGLRLCKQFDIHTMQ